MVGFTTMIDEEMRKRLGGLEETVVEEEVSGIRLVYRMLVKEAYYKRPNKAELSWCVRGKAGAVSFDLVVEELGPDRPRVLFPRTVAGLHRRAPVWMKDRTCLHLGGYFCECVPSEHYGKELFRLWYERADGPDTVWSDLLDAYFKAFPGETWDPEIPTQIRVVAGKSGSDDRKRK